MAKATQSKATAPKAVATPTGMSDKNHLIDIIQSHTGGSKIASKQALDAIIDTISVSLKKNKKVQLLGFGTFEVAKRKARTGRNPATGEPIKIKASRTVRFRAGTKLRPTI